VTKAIEAKNLTAQLQYRAAGNPPSASPDAAISNSFPGLEMDVRHLFTRLFAGIQLHEGSNFVVSVDDDAPPALHELANGYLLVRVGTVDVTVPVKGPRHPGGPDVALTNQSVGGTTMALEWSNALAEIVREHAGGSVECTFVTLDGKTTRSFVLPVRKVFDQEMVEGQPLERATVAREMLPPGTLTESLCAPWQYDYRYCACFYWAATRPDYVNVQTRPDATSTGNNWIERDRTPETPRVYIVDDFQNPHLLTIPNLIEGWERALQFVVGGIDQGQAPPAPKAPGTAQTEPPATKPDEPHS
jgi:hypothetical protein